MSGYRNGKRQWETDPREETVKGIQLTIYHLGDKHPSLSPEEDLAATLKMILDERKDFTPEIISSVTACLLEVPHKLDHYCKLMAALNLEDGVLTGKLLVDFSDTLNRSIGVGNWKHLVQGVRAILELARLGVISQESVKQLFNALVSMSKENVFVRWLLLATLPFATNASEIYASTPEKNPVDGLFDLNDLLTLIGQLAAANFEGLSKESSESSNAHQLTPLDFGSLTVDPMWDGTFQYMSIFTDTFEPSEAPSAKFLQWWTVLQLRMVFETYELNHPKLAETLLAVPSEAIGHPEKIVAEFLFGELLRQRKNGLRQVLSEIVMMGCCRITRLFPPIMARALLALVARIEDLDAVQRDHLASWFAHHLSNFDFKWKWDEWKDITDLPPTAAKRLFVLSVWEKLLRLSYHDRIVESLPEWALPLLPPAPELTYKYDGDDSEESALAKRVLEAIQQRSSVEEVKDLLVLPDGSAHSAARPIFLSALLMAGSKTFSHSVILIERYLPILQFLHPKGDLPARLETIRVIHAFWERSIQHFEFILERLIHYRILTAHSVVAWTLDSAERALSDPSTPYDSVALGILQWGLLGQTLSQSRGFPETIRAKLDACSDEDIEQRTKLSHTLDTLKQEHADLLAFTRTGLARLPDSLTTADQDTASSVSKICQDFLRYI